MNSPILNIYRDNASHRVGSLPFAMEISSNSSLIISQTRQPQATQQSEQHDYRQLVLQARRQQVGVTQASRAGQEAYREGGEPLMVQQALGAYHDHAKLADGGTELMPRIDGYV